MIALFCTPEDIKRYNPIDGSVDEDKFLTYIETAQRYHIQRTLGTKLYERLQAGIVANDLNTDEQNLLDNYVNITLIFHACADYLPFAAFDVKNGGVYRHTAENSAFASTDDINFLTKKVRSKAEYENKQMVKYLCNNSIKFPEYSQNTSGDIYPDKKPDYTGGWHLGGSRVYNWRTDD